jgi:hypothetical protein
MKEDHSLRFCAGGRFGGLPFLSSGYRLLVAQTGPSG